VACVCPLMSDILLQELMLACPLKFGLSTAQIYMMDAALGIGLTFLSARFPASSGTNHPSFSAQQICISENICVIPIWEPQ